MDDVLFTCASMSLAVESGVQRGFSDALASTSFIYSSAGTGWDGGVSRCCMLGRSPAVLAVSRLSKRESHTVMFVCVACVQRVDGFGMLTPAHANTHKGRKLGQCS